MQHPSLLFIDYPDKTISYIEYNAFRLLYLKPNKLHLDEVCPSIEQRWTFWADEFSSLYQKAPKDWRVKLYQRASNDAKTFDAAQDIICEEVRFERKKPRGKILKAKKKIVAQSAFQQTKLGDDFIHNDKLISAAKYSCVQLASDWADISKIKEVAANLEAEHCDDPLTDGQIQTLLNEIMLPRIEKLKTPSIVESKILESGNKKLYFLWGRIKQHCSVGGEIDLAQSQVIKLASVSGRDALPLVKGLEKLGALELIRKPKKGSRNGTGGRYKRLV